MKNTSFHFPGLNIFLDDFFLAVAGQNRSYQCCFSSKGHILSSKVSVLCMLKKEIHPQIFIKVPKELPKNRTIG